LNALILVLSLALPASGAETRVELSVGGQINVANASALPSQLGPLDWSRIGGGGSLGVGVYLGRKLVDDDAPLSLQPFLQRKTTLSLFGNGAGLSSDWNQGALRVAHRDWRQGSVTMSAGGYIRSRFYLSGSVGFSYTAWNDRVPWSGGPIPAPPSSVSMTTLALSAVLGWRIVDTLLYAGWGVTVVSNGDSNAPSRVPFWGGAYAGAQTVLKRRIELQASVGVLDGGASARAWGEIFFGRRLGIFAGVYGGAGKSSDTNDPFRYSFAGGEVGVGLWMSPRVRLDITYAPSWEKPDRSSDEIYHYLMFTLVARL
jgi:hypothetical protein